jgi:autotransporter-associated beta strand protein
MQPNGLLAVRHSARFFLAAVVLFFISGNRMSAQTWNTNASGTWGVGANWTGGSVPNAVDATATLGSVITANRVVTVSSPVTLGNLILNDNNRYTVTGSTLTFDVTSGSAGISASGAGGGGGGHAISSAISLNDNLAVNRDSAGALAITGAISNNGNSITVNASNSVVFGGAVSGAGGFIKNGNATVTLNGAAANTFTGTTQVNNGTLSLSKSTGITAVAGNLTIGDGTGAAGSAGVAVASNEQIANTSAVTIASDGRLTLNSSRTETIGALNATSGTASVVLSTGSTLYVGNGTAPAGSFAGVISGAGNLRKIGNGTLTLSGANTYAGATTVTSGVLNIRNSSALGTSAGATTVSSGAQLQIQGGISVTENLTISGTGVGGTGVLRNMSGNNTLGGPVVRAASSTIQSDAGRLTLSGAMRGNNTLTVTGAGDTAISGAISGSTSAILYKTGTGTLTLSGANTYAGRTEINGGTLSISADNNLGAAPATATTGHLRFAGGTLDSTATLTLNANRRITLNAGGGTFAPDAGTSLTYAGLISGVGGLVKTDAGTLRLSGGAGNNTYTGTTTVSGGTLALAKTSGQNAVGPGAILLNSGGTLLLENSNQIGNTTAMTLAGGTFSTGTGFSETLGVLTLALDSAITLGAGLHNLRFGASNLAAWSPTATLTIYGWSGTAGLGGTAGQIFFGTGATALTLAQLSMISFNGYTGAQLLASGELVPMAVPESRALLAALAVLGAILWRERGRILGWKNRGVRADL